MSVYKRIIWAVWLIVAALVYGFVGGIGCGKTIPSPNDRLTQIRCLTLTETALKETVFQTTRFPLFSYYSPLFMGKKIHIYIEGDGLAWITSSIVSDNPTPLNPVGLKLFVQHPSPGKIYLARPCQYVAKGKCSKKYWTSHRFSREVINSYHEVLDRIQDEYKPSSFVLFGYSGGGAVAALLAAQRDDVSRVVTIAGNLDTKFWVQKHGISPLTGSLNPADFSSALQGIEQFHFMGGRDDNILPAVFFSYQKKFANKDNLHYKIFNEFDHSCCWDKAWESILNTFRN